MISAPRRAAGRRAPRGFALDGAGDACRRASSGGDRAVVQTARDAASTASERGGGPLGVRPSGCRTRPRRRIRFARGCPFRRPPSPGATRGWPGCRRPPAVSHADLASLGIGHHATRFADEQRAGRDVPGRQPLFPEALEPAGGHVREIDGGGAGSADAGCVARATRANWRWYSLETRQVLERKTGTDESEPGSGHRRDRSRWSRHHAPTPRAAQDT